MANTTKMNTISYNIPILKPRKHGEYVIILEDLEFCFPVEQLDYIEKLHNSGFRISEISEYTKRNEYEVLLAIIHLHREGRITRPLKGFRRCTFEY